MAFDLLNEQKTIVIITIYRILQSIIKGTTTSITQYNQSNTQIKLPIVYRR